MNEILRKVDEKGSSIWEKQVLFIDYVRCSKLWESSGGWKKAETYLNQAETAHATTRKTVPCFWRSRTVLLYPARDFSPKTIGSDYSFTENGSVNVFSASLSYFTRALSLEKNFLINAEPRDNAEPELTWNEQDWISTNSFQTDALVHITRRGKGDRQIIWWCEKLPPSVTRYLSLFLFTPEIIYQLRRFSNSLYFKFSYLTFADLISLARWRIKTPPALRNSRFSVRIFFRMSRAEDSSKRLMSSEVVVPTMRLISLRYVITFFEVYV